MENNIINQAILVGTVDSVEDNKLYVKIRRSKSDNYDIVPVWTKEVFEVGERIKIEGIIATKDIKINSSKYKHLVFIKANTIESTEEHDLNQILFNGFNTKEIIHRETPSGKLISDLFIANNYDKSNAYYIPCIAFGDNALYAEEIEIGDEKLFTGYFQSREYIKRINDEEISMTAYEVVLTKFDTNDKAE